MRHAVVCRCGYQSKRIEKYKCLELRLGHRIVAEPPFWCMPNFALVAIVFPTFYTHAVTCNMYRHVDPFPPPPEIPVELVSCTAAVPNPVLDELRRLVAC